jgi:hypothetical protein
LDSGGSETLTIGRRFVGPPGRAQGGYLAGRIASLMSGGPAAEVKLRAPTPLATPLVVDRSDASHIRLLVEGEVCAECTSCDFELDRTALVTYEEAEQAGAEALEWILERVSTEVRRDFEAVDERDRCFGCLRLADGLRALPGRVGSRDVAAAAVRVPRDLVVDGVVPAEIVWAMLDCPSMWTCRLLADPEEGLLDRPAFTGTLSVKIRRLPLQDEALFVQAWRLGRERRKLFGAAVLVGADAEILAEARQTSVVA